MSEEKEKLALRQKAREKLKVTITHAEQMQASFQELNDVEEVMTKEFKDIAPGGEISESHEKLTALLKNNAAYIKELYAMVSVFDEAEKIKQ